MSNPLSSAQFGTGIEKPSASYTVHKSEAHSDLAMSAGDSTPLPLKSETNNSAGQAAAWRLRRVLPYGSATSGSTFLPY